MMTRVMLRSRKPTAPPRICLRYAIIQRAHRTLQERTTTMWNTRKQRQLDALRSREEQATLTPKERQRLATLLRELEQDELASLRPALDAHEQEQRRLQDELGQIRTRNAAIAGLA